MRAMTALLEAANAATYHAANHKDGIQAAGHSGLSADVGSPANPAGVEGSASLQASASPRVSAAGPKGADVGSPRVAAFTKGFLNSRASVAPRSTRRSPHGSVRQQKAGQAVGAQEQSAANEGVHSKAESATPHAHVASIAAGHAADDAAAAYSSTASDHEEAEVDAAAENADDDELEAADAAAEQLAAARRQKIVDDAMDRLFEESPDTPSSVQSSSSSEDDPNSQWAGSDNLEQLSGSEATDQDADKEQGEQQQQGEAEGGDRDEEELQELLDGLGLQAHDAIQAAMHSALHSLQASDHMSGMETQATSGVAPEVAPGDTLGGAIGGTAEVPHGAMPQDLFGVLQTPVKGLVPSHPRGLPPLAPPRGTSTVQQGAAAVVGEASRSSSTNETQLSQDQMQTLVDQMFNLGFETMGQLSSGNTALPGTAAAAILDSASGSASAAGAEASHDDASENSHADLQRAFNQEVATALERQAAFRNRQSDRAASTQGGNISAAARSAAGTTAAAPPTTVAPAPSTSTSAAAATQLQRHQDDLPRRIVARERETVRREYRRDQVPRHHSLFVNYDDQHHVDGITEQTHCSRQIGFGVERRRQRSRVQLAARVLFGVGVAVLTAGLATRRVYWHHSSIVSDETEGHSEQGSAEESDSDSNDSHMY